MSGPAAGLIALIERFDPEVINLPSGSARIRLSVDGEGEWEAMIDDGAIKLQLPSGRQPDALLSADRATWEEIARDVRGCSFAFLRQCFRALAVCFFLHFLSAAARWPVAQVEVFVSWVSSPRPSPSQSGSTIAETEMRDPLPEILDV